MSAKSNHLSLERKRLSILAYSQRLRKIEQAEAKIELVVVLPNSGIFFEICRDNIEFRKKRLQTANCLILTCAFLFCLDAISCEMHDTCTLEWHHLLGVDMESTLSIIFDLACLCMLGYACSQQEKQVIWCWLPSSWRSRAVYFAYFSHIHQRLSTCISISLHTNRKEKAPVCVIGIG